VDREDRVGVGLADDPAGVLRVERERPWIDVGKRRLCPRQSDRVRAGDEGKRRRDDRIARPDPHAL
jgi:hypothetical protein